MLLITIKSEPGKPKGRDFFVVQMEGVTVPHLPVEDSVKGLDIEIARCLTCVRESRENTPSPFFGQ